MSTVDFRVVVDACGVGDESDALAAEAFKIIVARTSMPGLTCAVAAQAKRAIEAAIIAFSFINLLLRPKLGSILRNAHTPMVAAQQIIVQIKKWR